MTDATRLDRVRERLLRAEQRERDLRERRRRHTRQLQERGDRVWRYHNHLQQSLARNAPRRQRHLLLAEQRYWLNVYRRPM